MITAFFSDLRVDTMLSAMLSKQATDLVRVREVRHVCEATVCGNVTYRMRRRSDETRPATVKLLEAIGIRNGAATPHQNELTSDVRNL